MAPRTCDGLRLELIALERQPAVPTPSPGQPPPVLRPLDTKQQTVCHFWSQGQIEKLVLRITGRISNSVVGVKHHREGLCERLELVLRDGTSVFVDSA